MRDTLRNSIWGIIFIALGLVFGGNALNLWNISIFFDGWWTLFIIVPCAISMFQNGLRVGNIIGVVIGAILLLSEQNIIDSELIGKLIFPLILLGVGLSIVFRGSWGKKMVVYNEFHKEGIADYVAIFGGQDCKLSGENFYGANIIAVFGGIDLNLKNSIIDHDVQITTTTIFGGADIIVPSNVKVKVISTPIFGGVSNKVASNNDDNAPTIFINSICIFGGVDVK